MADGGRRDRAADGGRGSVEVVLGEAGGPGGGPIVPIPTPTPAAAAASGEGGGAPFVPTSAAPGKGGGGEEAEEGGDPRGCGRGGGRRRREVAVEEGFAEDEHFGVPLARVGCCSSAVSMVDELPEQSESGRDLAWHGQPSLIWSTSKLLSSLNKILVLYPLSKKKKKMALLN